MQRPRSRKVRVEIATVDDVINTALNRESRGLRQDPPKIAIIHTVVASVDRHVKIHN